MMKKAQSISINTVIVAAIALIVLIVVKTIIDVKFHLRQHMAAAAAGQPVLPQERPVD